MDQHGLWNWTYFLRGSYAYRIKTNRSSREKKQKQILIYACSSAEQLWSSKPFSSTSIRPLQRAKQWVCHAHACTTLCWARMARGWKLMRNPMHPRYHRSEQLPNHSFSDVMIVAPRTSSWNIVWIQWRFRPESVSRTRLFAWTFTKLTPKCRQRSPEFVCPQTKIAINLAWTSVHRQ